MPVMRLSLPGVFGGDRPRLPFAVDSRVANLIIVIDVDGLTEER